MKDNHLGIYLDKLDQIHTKTGERLIDELRYFNRDEEEYMTQLASLTYLKNKELFVDKTKSFAIASGLLRLAPLIDADNFNYHIDQYGYRMTIAFADSNKNILNWRFGFNDGATSRILDDKVHTSHILREAGFPVAENMILVHSMSKWSNDENDYQAVARFVEKVGFPVVAKPINGSQGKGFWFIHNQEELDRFVTRYDEGRCVYGTAHYMFERFVPGEDYRVLYLDGHIHVAYKRIPAIMIGDGETALGDYVVNLNLMKTAKVTMLEYLAFKGYDLSYVPNKGEHVRLSIAANISRGATATQVGFTDKEKQYVQDIANAMGARYMGLDILSEGDLMDGTIIEINDAPGIDGIAREVPEMAENFMKVVWDTIKKDEGLEQ